MSSNQCGNRRPDFNFDAFDLGDQIRVVINGFTNGFNQTGFFIAFDNGLLYWGSIVDNVARLIITPVRSIDSIVRL